MHASVEKLGQAQIEPQELEEEIHISAPVSNPSESDSEDVISTDLLCFLLRVVLYGIINGP